MAIPTLEDVTDVLRRLNNSASWLGEADFLVADLLAWLEGENTEIYDWAMSLCPDCGVAPAVSKYSRSHTNWCKAGG